MNTSPHLSLPFVARTSKRRCDAMCAAEDGEGRSRTTSNRLEGARLVTTCESVAAVEGGVVNGG
jgi:hypothetical protein